MKTVYRGNIDDLVNCNYVMLVFVDDWSKLENSSFEEMTTDYISELFKESTMITRSNYDDVEHDIHYENELIYEDSGEIDKLNYLFYYSPFGDCLGYTDLSQVISFGDDSEYDIKRLIIKLDFVIVNKEIVPLIKFDYSEHLSDTINKKSHKVIVGDQTTKLSQIEELGYGKKLFTKNLIDLNHRLINEDQSIFRYSNRLNNDLRTVVSSTEYNILPSGRVVRSINPLDVFKVNNEVFILGTRVTGRNKVLYLFRYRNGGRSEFSLTITNINLVAYGSNYFVFEKGGVYYIQSLSEITSGSIWSTPITDDNIIKSPYKNAEWVFCKDPLTKRVHSYLLNKGQLVLMDKSLEYQLMRYNLSESINQSKVVEYTNDNFVVIRELDIANPSDLSRSTHKIYCGNNIVEVDGNYDIIPVTKGSFIVINGSEYYHYEFLFEVNSIPRITYLGSSGHLRKLHKVARLRHTNLESVTLTNLNLGGCCFIRTGNKLTLL